MADFRTRIREIAEEHNRRKEMSTLKPHEEVVPITWDVIRLICGCGGEFEHKFSIKYADKPFTHVCNKCSSVQNMEDIYPKPKWKEV